MALKKGGEYKVIAEKLQRGSRIMTDKYTRFRNVKAIYLREESSECSPLGKAQLRAGVWRDTVCLAAGTGFVLTPPQPSL